METSYHPSNNELVRTNTLTKSAIVQIDATPFRNHYETFYGITIGKSKRGRQTTGEAKTEAPEEQKRSRKVERKLAARQTNAKIEPAVESQFANGRLYAVISSRPGQSGRADGYILEGEELSFYLRKMTAKK
jgi:small subunit ribosomal protein S8e